MRKFSLLFALFIGFIQSVDAVYINRYSATVNGGITFTGNSLGLSKQSGANQPGVSDAIGAFITTNSALSVGNYPPSSNPSAGTTLNYTLSNSSAVLDLPPGSQVLYAELIWMGSFGFGGQIPFSNFAAVPGAVSVNLTTPQGVTNSISPTGGTFQWAFTPSFPTSGNYVISQDVTTIIQNSMSGVYTVGGVPATSAASDNTHNACGWVLAVAYENASMLTNNLTIFVGCEQASAGNNPALISGFCAPPSGAKNARLFVSALEGDYAKTGDQLRFGPTTPLTAANAVSGSNNPINNFFCSQINTLLPLARSIGTGKLGALGSSVLDTRGSYGVKNFPISGAYPNNFGRQGTDITSVDVSSRINYNQTQAYVQGTTSGDDYTISALALQIQIGSPILESNKLVNGQEFVVLNVGDTVTFSIEITNSGTADANSCQFIDALPAGLTFVPGSFVLNGVSVPSVTNPANPLALNTITVGETVTIQFQAQVSSLPGDGQAIFTNRGETTYDFQPCGGSTQNFTSSTNEVEVNFFPIANPDEAWTEINTPLDGSSVLDNDIGTNLVVVPVVNGPTSEGGTVTLNSDGTYNYVPLFNFIGDDTFSYTAVDKFGNEVTALVTIHVKGNRVPPEANDDSNMTYVNTLLVGPSVLDNDIFNPPDSPPVITSYDNESQEGGQVVMDVNTGTYSYIPPLDFTGLDSFTYTIIDADGNESTATVYIRVYPRIMPEANPDGGTTLMNQPFSGPSLITNDVGNDISIYTYTQGQQGGIVTINPDNTYTYTPPLNFTGIDTFTYSIRDVFGNVSTATVTIRVLPLTPLNFIGTIESCKLLNKTKYTLVATWNASASPTVVAYHIYLNGLFVESIPARGPFVFRECLASKSSSLNYTLTAVDSFGVESNPVQLVVK